MSTGSRVAVVSVSLPDHLVKEVDRFIHSHGYSGRSDFIRAALRDFVQTVAGEEKRAGRRSATLTALYPVALERRVGEVAHDFSGVITSTMHAHVGNGRCLTVYIAEGDVERIRELTARLNGLRDADVVRLTYTDVAARGA